ncbi:MULTISPECIES: hypothetical protein [Streptomyces]|uniref:hypothetical protein n=1 Tax=Streptomyces TaxID=1883 RepID=UPI001783D987|nr:MULTISPECIES: hypothetical protein [unclassified Streptomyces]MBQ0914710.1 hypothetical protein [Streptomyces sp. RM99]UAX57857.1 hypothetical protein K5X85_35015 [Streptomyces sp. A144]
MFQNWDEFKRAAAEARPLYINSAREEDKKGLETAFSEERVRVAFNVYKAAQWAMESHKDKGLIAGNRLDQDEVIATEKIPGIDAEVIKNFRTMSEATERGVGQVLDSSKWTILVNDAWLLGGAHYIAQFFLASPRTSENLCRTVRPDWFKKTRQFRPGFTVFSRELIGLTACGYKFEGHRTTGEIAYLPQKAGHPGSFTFVDYQTKVNQYTQSDQWRSLIDPARR